MNSIESFIANWPTGEQKRSIVICIWQIRNKVAGAKESGEYTTNLEEVAMEFVQH